MVDNGERVQFWHAHFTPHGDPHVVSDVRRPWSTHVATVDTSPEDYGRANALLIAAAPLMLDALRVIQATATCGFTADANLLSIESIARHALREAGVAPYGGIVDG